MSRPDLDIVRSPAAKTFLRSVTEGFYDRSYAGLWMYEVIGREWDEMAKWSNGLKREVFVQTCTWSIGIWEWVYGFEPDETMTLEERRQRILSKVLGVRPINPEVLRRGIAAVAGADVEVTDLTAPYTFSITLNITNQPVPCDRVFQYISEVKPAHLAVNVVIMFPTIKNTLHVGGGAGAAVWMGVPKEEDTFDFQSTLSVGGAAGADVSISIPEEPDTLDFRAALHTGGNGGIQSAVGVPEDTAVPPAVTILRTGGVCTIISNRSRGE